jgi:hypothetical protein
MTRDDIIRMAQSVRDWGHWDQDDLVRFAALVAAAEREACANLCVEEKALRLAEKIRARGEAK